MAMGPLIGGKATSCCCLSLSFSVLLFGCWSLFSGAGSILTFWNDRERWMLESTTSMIIWLLRVLISLTSGFAALTNVLIFRRWVTIATFNLIIVAVQWLVWSAQVYLTFNILTYGYQAIDVPDPSLWGIVPCYMYGLLNEIYHLFAVERAHYVIAMAIFLTFEFFWNIFVTDLMLSYYNVLSFGGTGWERKSYIRIDDEVYQQMRRLI